MKHRQVHTLPGLVGHRGARDTWHVSSGQAAGPGRGHGSGAVSLMLEVDPSEIAVTVALALSSDVDEHVRAAKRLMARALEAQLEASKASHPVVHEMRGVDGLSGRVVAQLPEVRPQRVSQLAPSSAKASSIR